MWTSVMCHTALPALPWHGPAPPCNLLCCVSVAVRPGPLRPPLLPPLPQLSPKPPAPPLRAARPVPQPWESPYTSVTLRSSSASSWCAEQMSLECLCWTCLREGWQRKTAGSVAMTECWPSTTRTSVMAPQSKLHRSYRFEFLLYNRFL